MSFTKEEAERKERWAYALRERADQRYQELECWIYERANEYATIIRNDTSRRIRFNHIDWERNSLSRTTIEVEARSWDDDVRDTIDLPTQWLYRPLDELREEIKRKREEDARKRREAAAANKDKAEADALALYLKLKQRFEPAV